MQHFLRLIKVIMENYLNPMEGYWQVRIKQDSAS